MTEANLGHAHVLLHAWQQKHSRDRIGTSHVGTTGMTSLSCPCQAGNVRTPETG